MAYIRLWLLQLIFCKALQSRLSNGEVMVPVLFKRGQYLQRGLLQRLGLRVGLGSGGSLGGILAFTRMSLRLGNRRRPVTNPLSKSQRVLLFLPRRSQFVLTIDLRGFNCGS